MAIHGNNGRVFFWKNRVFRAVKREYSDQCRDLFTCGLIAKLIEVDLIPDSWITDFSLDGYDMVLESKNISVTTFPQEWTFSMLKDAAIAVLQVNIISAKFGYQTLDCHGFNILFDGCNPKFIDLGSFVKIINPNRNWAAYDEFIRCYYHVLLIWSKGKFYLANRILSDNNWKRFSPHDDYYLEESGLKAKRQLTLGELLDKIERVILQMDPEQQVLYNIIKQSA